jgi:hypothetical protein
MPNPFMPNTPTPNDVRSSEPSTLGDRSFDAAFGPAYDSRNDPHLLDFLTLLARAKWALVVLSVVGGVVALWLTYKLPQTYEAQAMILPPDKGSSLGLLDRFKSESGALKMLKAVENPSVDLLQNILESRRVDREIAKDSQCTAFYNKYVEPRGEYTNIGEWLHSTVKVDPRISILYVSSSVETGWNAGDQENEAAKQLAGRIPMIAIDHMNEFIVSELQSDSRTSRMNAEIEYGDRQSELDSLERGLEKYQVENHAAALPDQIRALMKATAQLRAELVQDEIKKSVAEHDFNETARPVVELHNRIDAVTSALDRTEEPGPLGPGLTQLPSVQRHMASMELRIETLEPIVEFLRTEIEQARIHEARAHTSVQVLDPAIAPKKKSSPKRAPFVLLGITAAFALVAAYVLITRLWQNFKRDVRRRSEGELAV